ncbi:alpha/beta hydrolase-fold protein [Streptomyces sp. NPDC089919]|uniref:alpha/beta hydrolase n=1 Tax=Streptomyces sp. NPDC089919 TaxID=3155188 RepID=UPI0034332246
MALTSSSLLWALALGVLVVSGLVLWLWPRAARGGIAGWSARIGLLLVAQFALLSVLLVGANRTFGFYSSWAELFGRASSQQSLNEATGDGKRPPALTVKGVESIGLKGTKEVAGQVERVDIRGPLTGLTMSGYVYLPPQYYQRGHEQEKFPVVVAVTGQPGISKNLITQLKVPQSVSAAVMAKKIRPTIYVLVRPSLVPGRDTNCTDVPGGPQALTFFNQDLPLAVAARYRTTDAPGSWGAVGNSTGGYCALKFAMTNPARYGAAAGLSADYFARQDRDTGDLYDRSAKLRRESDLIWRLKNRPAPPVSLLLSSSKQGEANYKPTLDFAAAAKAPTRVAQLIREEGGHNFQTWREEYPEVILWLDRELQRPAS